MFDDDGADVLLSILSTFKEPETIVACLQVAQACCLKHEKNRQVENILKPFLLQRMLTVYLAEN